MQLHGWQRARSTRHALRQHVRCALLHGQSSRMRSALAADGGATGLRGVQQAEQSQRGGAKRQRGGVLAQRVVRLRRVAVSK